MHLEMQSWYMNARRRENVHTFVGQSAAVEGAESAGYSNLAASKAASATLSGTQSPCSSWNSA